MWTFTVTKTQNVSHYPVLMPALTHEIKVFKWPFKKTYECPLHGKCEYTLNCKFIGLAAGSWLVWEHCPVYSGLTALPVRAGHRTELSCAKFWVCLYWLKCVISQWRQSLPQTPNHKPQKRKRDFILVAAPRWWTESNLKKEELVLLGGLGE